MNLTNSLLGAVLLTTAALGTAQAQETPAPVEPTGMTAPPMKLQLRADLGYAMWSLPVGAGQSVDVKTPNFNVGARFGITDMIDVGAQFGYHKTTSDPSGFELKFYALRLEARAALNAGPVKILTGVAGIFDLTPNEEGEDRDRFAGIAIEGQFHYAVSPELTLVVGGGPPVILEALGRSTISSGLLTINNDFDLIQANLQIGVDFRLSPTMVLHGVLPIGMISLIKPDQPSGDPAEDDDGAFIGADFFGLQAGATFQVSPQLDVGGKLTYVRMMGDDGADDTNAFSILVNGTFRL